MSSSNILIDGDNVLYRAAYQISSRHSSKEPMFGPDCVSVFFSIVRSVVNKFYPEKVFIVWDGDRSKRRMDLFPEYKGHRKKKDEETTRKKLNDISTINRIAGQLNMRFVAFPNKETDDVISMLAKLLGSAVIISEDSDFLQLVSDDVSIYCHNSKKFYSSLTFSEYYPFSPKQIALYKALVGDKSDGINGVPGIGPVNATRVLSTNKSITTLPALRESLLFKRSDNKVKKILDNEHIIQRNLELMDIQKEIFTEAEIETLRNSISVATEFNEKVITELEKCGMVLISSFFTSWSMPFRRLS